jgi:hypothetical protein
MVGGVVTAARPVEQSMFPGHAPDRPRGHLLGSVVTGTNADLIAAIAPLYLDGRSVLDVTYGEGGWWKRYRPDQFIYHDLYKVDGVDFRALPESGNSIDVVCYDPPYIPAGGSGTTTVAAFRASYGIAPYRSQWELADLIRDGLVEVARVARQWLLIKCSDYVNGGRFVLGHMQIIRWAEDIGLGDPHDLIVHHTGPGPGGHNIYTPRRARRHHSYLLVFDVRR